MAESLKTASLLNSAHLKASLMSSLQPSHHIQKVDLPMQFVQHQPVITPLALIDYRRSSENAPWEVLVQWDGLSPDET